MARLRSEPAYVRPPRWHGVLGPVVAGLGILLLIGWALSV
jgi:hypothetical protein